MRPFFSELIRHVWPSRFAYVSEISQRQTGATPPPLAKAIERAIAVAERLAAQPASQPNSANYAALLEQLHALRDRAVKGETITTEELGGVVRFVSDWVPDEQFGLIGQLGSVVRAAQRSGGRRKRRASR